MNVKVEGPPEIVSALQRGETVKGWVPVVDVAGTTLNSPVVKVVPWHEAAYVHSVAEGETDDYLNPALEGSDVLEGSEGGLDRLSDGGYTPSEEELARIRANAPKPVPISHADRLKNIVDTLVEFGQASLRVKGYVEWPQSIVRELEAMGWRSGQPNAWRDQIEPLARRFITQAANQVKEADQHKVAIDHAGRYSA